MLCLRANNRNNKKLLHVIAKANFSEGRFKARVRLILSVDMNRYSFAGVSYKLAIYPEYALVSTEEEVNHNAD